MRSVILENHIPKSHFALIVTGVNADKAINFIEFSGFEEKLDTVMLPDRTRVTGQRSQPLEVKARIPAHHKDEIAALDAWLLRAKSKNTTGYKKTATLSFTSISDSLVSYSMNGMFPTGRATDDMMLENEADMATIEYTFSIDTASVQGA
jgi:hypothetical protein